MTRKIPERESQAVVLMLLGFMTTIVVMVSLILILMA